jgi:hypothetical protein
MEESLTLIASLRCSDGLILAADTEEVITEPPLLRTRREKIRVLETPAISNWRVILGGAGEYDYIGMIGDLIEERISNCGTFSPTHAHIGNSIRAAVAQVWRDYARYEQRTIDIKILIASRADQQGPFRLTVVSGAAVRRGLEVEAIGIGDATFRALTDRFIQHGQGSTVSASVSAARIFVVYAMLQAKLSIPGIGGNTRIVTMTDDGDFRYMKSWSVSAIQGFFSTLDHNIRMGVQSLSHVPSGDYPVEQLLTALSQETIKEYRKLKKELQRIEEDPSLV